MPMLISANSNNTRIKQKTMASMMVYNDPENKGLLEGKSETVATVNLSSVDESAMATTVPITMISSSGNQNHCSDDHTSPQKTTVAVVSSSVSGSNRSQPIYDECSNICRLSPPTVSQLSGSMMGGHSAFSVSYGDNNNKGNAIISSADTAPVQRVGGNTNSKINCVEGHEPQKDGTSHLKHNTLDESTACYSVVRKVPATKLEQINSNVRKQSHLTPSGNDLTSVDRKTAAASIVSQVAAAENLVKKSTDDNKRPDTGTTDMNPGILRSLLGGDDTQGRYSNSSQSRIELHLYYDLICSKHISMKMYYYISLFKLISLCFISPTFDYNEKSMKICNMYYYNIS